MNAIDEKLRQDLISMAEEDLRVREELAATGELFEGYHPKMEAVHLKNAARLTEMIEQYGWLGKSKVGEKGAKAAWLIAQHAIGNPSLQRKVLRLIEEEVRRGEVPAYQAAYLEDRIRFFEGKPQIYGTQFNWNERGEMSPQEILQPENIDERRAEAGLEVPYSKVIKAHREATRKSNEKPPANFGERQKEFEEWARRTGWRK